METILNGVKCLFLAGIVLLFSQSCADDLGNYTYHDINEIAISGIDQSYAIRVGETITIKPVINATLTGDEDAEYSYQWMLCDVTYKGRYYNRYTWSRLKEWDDHQLGLAGGNYKFYYQVNDLKTGVSWTSDFFSVYIENDISLGIFVLSDVNDVGRVDFVNYTGNKKFDLKLDILNSIGTELPPLNKPLGAVCWLEDNSPYWGAKSKNADNYMIGVLTETGGYRLHPYTFAYENDYNWRNSFLADSYLPSDFYVKNVFTHGGSGSSTFATLDNLNNIYYTYYVVSLYASAGVYTNVTSEGVKINVSPIMVYTPSGLVCYDIDTKSFTSQGGIEKTYLSKYASTLEKTHEFNGETLLFKYNDTGKDLVFMDCRSYDTGVNSGINNVYAILKDPDTGELFLACFSGTTTSSLSASKGVQRFYRALRDLPELSNAVEFAITRKANPNNHYANSILYYRTEERIYAYNMSDGTTKLVYPLGDVSQDGYTKISRMKFFPCSVTATAWLRDRLAVCTYNPGDPAESCGRLQILGSANNSNTGELFLMENSNADYPQKLDWTGFGKIIDLDLKNK